MEVPGRFVDARQNGAIARLVIDSEPQPFIATARQSSAEQAGVTPLPRPDRAARASSAGKTFRRNLAPCDAVTHPAQFSGLGVLAILTVDLDRGMYSLDRDGVMAGAQVVYGSDRQPLRRQPPLRARARARQRRARGHADRDPPLRHLRPGRDRLPRDRHGPGFILNNYALSEYDGDLRVASTEEPPWFPDGRGARARARSRCSSQDGDAARAGSAPSAGWARASGSTPCASWASSGYVVTFRQIDPLYTLDLSRPDGAEGRRRAEDPRLLRLSAPGRREPAARASGARARASRRRCSTSRTWPRRARSRSCSSAAGATPVETEPHAFLYWAPTNLAVMPLQTYQPAVHRRGRRADRAERAEPRSAGSCTTAPRAATTRRSSARS